MEMESNFIYFVLFKQLHNKFFKIWVF